MTKIPRPMLASNEVVEDLDSITYPVVASPKLDGWRSYNHSGLPRTRSGKTIPNISTRTILSRPELEGLDGELICGSPTDPNSMQKAQSAFSTIKGEPDFTWYIFDDWRRGADEYWVYYFTRLNQSSFRKLPSFCQLLPQAYLRSSRELEEFTSAVLAEGYEGVITRDPQSPYKHNRSTRKQEWMLKVKPYSYEEGIIVGLRERMTNYNEATTDELGFTKRSGHQNNKVGANTLGSFIVQSPEYNDIFGIGCGHLDDVGKQLIWDNRSDYSGRMVTFKHFKQTGTVDLPRHGQFVSFRAMEDLS